MTKSDRLPRYGDRAPGARAVWIVEAAGGPVAFGASSVRQRIFRDGRGGLVRRILSSTSSSSSACRQVPASACFRRLAWRLCISSARHLPGAYLRRLPVAAPLGGSLVEIRTGLAGKDYGRAHCTTSSSGAHAAIVTILVHGAMFRAPVVAGGDARPVAVREIRDPGFRGPRGALMSASGGGRRETARQSVAVSSTRYGSQRFTAITVLGRACWQRAATSSA